MPDKYTNIFFLILTASILGVCQFEVVIPPNITNPEPHTFSDNMASAGLAQSFAFAKDWANPEDAIYDNWRESYGVPAR